MTAKQARTALLSAGGTGGHLFPAEALAHELHARGWQVHLATDRRAERYSANFPAESVTIIPSATLSGKNPVAILRMAWKIFSGIRASGRLIRQIRPDIVIGFGGYPTVPPLLAADRAGVPAMLHEQNAILGRANRFLSGKVRLVATGFSLVGGGSKAPVVMTGNPMRPVVIEAASRPYPRREAQGRFSMLVFGGSQGARFFSQIMPKALATLDENRRARVDLVQQSREEDLEAFRAGCLEAGVEVETAPFFSDLPGRIANAHLVMGRAGASTVGECAVIGRPAILVPLPGSLDGDQAANATAMAEAGGAFVVPQKELDAERLAELIANAMDEPERLSEMAAAARGSGIADAAARLADCAECVISGGDPAKLAFARQ